MKGWEEVKLGDVAKRVASGGTPSTKRNDYYDGKIPWLNTKEICFNRIIKTEKNISEEGLKNSSAKWIDKNSVIVAMYGATAGKVAINKIPLTTNQACCNLTVDKEIADYNFIFYSLYDNYEKLEKMAVGAAQQNLSVSVISQFPIHLPPLHEQKAIAAVLSSLDDKIDLLHRQNQTLEDMAATLFREWFVEDADERWGEKPLGEILTICSSKRIFYKEYVNQGIPFYRSKEIIELKNNGITKSELFITHKRFNEIKSKYGSPKENDILLTSVGTLGACYRVKGDEKFYFKDGNLTWFKDFRLLPSAIIYAWLNSAMGKEILQSITIGSTQPALTLTGLRNIHLKIPVKTLISRLNNDLEIIYSKIDSNLSQIQTLTTLRNTLLPKLMNGEIRVKKKSFDFNKNNCPHK